jgi:Cu+-exporting ATPase
MATFDIDVPKIVGEHLKDMEKQAQTGILAAIDNEIIGLIAISDPLKAEAPAVISMLKSMGVQSIMVTGDNWGIANAIAREVGIDRVFAETLPQGKAEKVKELQVC